MANLTEVSQWESVIRQIENGEAATGGADGLANVQAKQLANRTQWLKDNYLPLSGGAMSGAIKATNDSLGTGMHGGTNTENGAHLGLFGRNNTSQGKTLAGCFSITTATNPADNYYCQLIGKMDKSLIWCGDDLAGSAIVAKSLNYNGYVKYASGLIVQYGHATIVQNTDSITITYPLSFKNSPVFFAVPSWDRTAGLYPFSCFTNETTGRFQLSQAYPSENNTVNWLAIGY